MHKYAVALLCVVLAACQRTPSEVVDKVLIDFGIRDKPPGYVSESDRVFERLNAVGRAEMERMNREGRHGAVKFQESDDFRGAYYKEVKVYEEFYPLDVRPSHGGSPTQDRGYVGMIEYAYRMYRSAPQPTRVEAAAESAAIPTDETGRETYRYSFSAGGVWNGSEGQRVRN